VPIELIAVVHQMCGIMVEMNTAVMEAKRYRRKKKKRSRRRRSGKRTNRTPQIVVINGNIVMEKEAIMKILNIKTIFQLK
jgi:hypothetical protein